MEHLIKVDWIQCLFILIWMSGFISYVQWNWILDGLFQFLTS